VRRFACQVVPGQQVAHAPAATSIVQVQLSVPLKLHSQVESVQLLSHSLPEPSRHDETHVVAPPGPPPVLPLPPPPPEQVPPPMGLGMLGQMAPGGAGTVPPPGATPDDPVPEEPEGEGLPAEQVIRVCRVASQPGNVTSPAAVHMGSADSAQRRNAVDSALQGPCSDACAQPLMQSCGFAACVHWSPATFWQVASHDEVTCAGEHAVPHEARAPPSSSGATVTVLPPQARPARADARVSAARAAWRARARWVAKGSLLPLHMLARQSGW
jgi:hypothetical protein